MSQVAPGPAGTKAPAPARSRKGSGNLRAMLGLILSRAVVVGAGFGSSVLWTNYFDRDTYGKYQILLAVISIVGSFCLAGLGEATLISAAKKKDGNLRPIVRLKLGASAIGAAVIAAWGVIRYRTSNPTLMVTFLVAAALFAPLQLQSIWQRFTNGKARFRALMLGQILLPCGSLAAVAFFSFSHSTAPSMLPWIVLSSQGATLVIVLALFRTLKQLTENDERDPAIVRYGHHVTAASLIAWVFSADRLIAGEALSASAAAVLTVAIVLPAQVKVFFKAFEQVFLPRVTAAPSIAAAWAYIRPRIVKLWSVYAALGVAGFFLLPVFIPLVFSHRYVAAVPYAKWLWLSTCLAAPFAFLASILNSHQHRRFLYARRLSGQLTTLVLFLVLIPRYGLVGAIAARIIHHAYLIVFNSVYFWRVLRGPGANEPIDRQTDSEE